MSNKQKAVNNLIDEWQAQLQECMSDPRVSELMIDYYAKFQNNIQEVSKSFMSENSADVNDAAASTDELNQRFEKLEVRIALLEKLLASVFK